MTAEHVIVVRDLGKEYTLGSRNDVFQYDLLRDTLTSAASALVARAPAPRHVDPPKVQREGVMDPFASEKVR